MSQSQFNVSKFDLECQLGDEIELTPFGDLHFETELFSKDHWERFKYQECTKIAHGKKTLYVGMGDYQDFMSDSERFCLQSSKFHDTTKKSFDQMVMDKLERFIKEIEFMRGRIIGLHEGNHYYTFPSGVTTTQLMCERLGCKYLGGTALHRIFLRLKNRLSFAVDIFSAHHGGGGRLAGSSINSVERMTDVAQADIYIHGHNHQRNALVVPKALFLNHSCTVKARKMVLCNSGSFLRAYVDGKESYAVKHWMKPTDIGTCTIIMVPTRRESKEESDSFVDFKVLS